METLKRKVIGILLILLGVMFITVEVSLFRENLGTVSMGELIGQGIFMVACAVPFLVLGVLVFTGFGMSRKEAREEDARANKAVRDQLFANYEAEADKTPLEKLLTRFRAEYAGAFAGKPMLKNVTQLFWHITALHQERLKAKGLTLSVESQRMRYDQSDSSVRSRQLTGGNYVITDASEEITSKRTYTDPRRGDKPIAVLEDNEVAHYTILGARKAGRGVLVCPSCGAEGSRESLIDGCDFCGAKFTVEDLSDRVASYALRKDFATAHKKYTGAVRRFRTRFVLGSVALVVLFFLPFAFTSIGDIGDDLLSAAIASIFTLVFLGGCAAFFAGLIVEPVYVFLQGLGMVGVVVNQRSVQSKKSQRQDRYIEPQVQRHDPLFSLPVFYNNLQNKLSTLIFAGGPRDANAFAAPGVDLSALAARYADCIDLDVSDVTLTDYRVEDGMQRAEVRAEMQLMEYKGRKARPRTETLRLRLVKSADCTTQELYAPHAVVLYGQARGAFEGNAIRRVRHDEVGALTAHEALHVFRFGGVPAEQPVPADRPEIAGLHKGGFLQRGGQIEVIILCFLLIIAHIGCQLFFIKAGERQVVSHLLQGFQFHLQQLFIPARIHCHAIVSQDVRLLLRFGQMIHIHAGYLGEAFLAGSGNPPMPGDDVVIAIDEDRVDEAEFP